MAGFGGMMQGVASLINGVSSAVNVGAQWTQNEKNLGFQKEVYRYQKRLQQKIFDREDNAIQRRVADLQASGLNKVLAAGQGAGSGATVPVTTPQGAVPDLSDVAKDFLAAAQMEADISRTVEQKNLLQQQQKTEKEKQGLVSTTNREKKHNLRISEQVGAPTQGATDTMRGIRDLAGAAQSPVLKPVIEKLTDKMVDFNNKYKNNQLKNSNNKVAPSQGNESYSGSW